jgi:hypothetical protein
MAFDEGYTPLMPPKRCLRGLAHLCLATSIVFGSSACERAVLVKEHGQHKLRIDEDSDKYSSQFEYKRRQEYDPDHSFPR